MKRNVSDDLVCIGEGEASGICFQRDRLERDAQQGANAACPRVLRTHVPPRLVLAFDQTTGRERWKEAVQSQNLMLERLTFSPYLVFASRKYEEPRKGRQAKA